ncbi:MAG: SUMF1/EgtB/PvdO family nonheme iron enzyme [Phycisphaerales bacterium]|nr:SUMF1/EgtB/PvdO family nonheme iron enzyme [Phycisphaerales bacterium]
MKHHCLVGIGGNGALVTLFVATSWLFAGPTNQENCGDGSVCRTSKKHIEQTEGEPRSLTLYLDGIDDLVSFVYVDSGTLTMGSGWFEKEGSLSAALSWWLFSSKQGNEGPKRKTTITKSFYIASVPVTAAQYSAFLNWQEDSQQYVIPSDWARVVDVDGDWQPRDGSGLCEVNCASWDGGVMFCVWLSEASGYNFRLPTEAEWALAVRGEEGRMTPWGEREFDVRRMGSNDPRGRFPDKYPHPWSCDPVGSYPGNATPGGLMDARGPVAEWCSDHYAHAFDPDQTIDPIGPPTGDYHAMRGRNSRATTRIAGGVYPAGIYGFRVVLEFPPEGKVDGKEECGPPTDKSVATSASDSASDPPRATREGATDD